VRERGPAWSALLAAACSGCAAVGAVGPAAKSSPRVTIEVEGGALWQNRNDVRIPADGGTRFSLADVAGEGPYPIGRVTVDWDIDDRHALRHVVAPLEFAGEGTLAQPVDFAGASFAAGAPVEAKYRFSNYRIGYRYTFHQDDRWRLRAGATLFLRDAEVQLTQGAVSASDSNVGLVPLANLAAEYRANQRFSLLAEFDGLAAPQGRALDFTLKGIYDLNEQCSLAFGYRTIEGGADNDEVYSFAWLNAWVASIRLRL
jgi:hypothetical protein